MRRCESASLPSVGRLQPLAWRELTTKVDARLVLAPALRFERDAGIAGHSEE